MSTQYVMQKLWSNVGGNGPNLCYDEIEENFCTVSVATLPSAGSCSRPGPQNGQSLILNGDANSIQAGIPLLGSVASGSSLDMVEVVPSRTYQVGVCALGAVARGACAHFAGTAKQEGAAVMAFPTPVDGNYGPGSVKACVPASGGVCQPGNALEPNSPLGQPLCCQSLYTYEFDTTQLYAIIPEIPHAIAAPVPALPWKGSIFLAVALGLLATAVLQRKGVRT
jgi:hypothetical protein